MSSLGSNLRVQLRLGLYGAQFEMLRFTGKIPMQWIRHSVYRMSGMKLSPTAIVYGGAEVRHPAGISIGEYTSVGHRCVLDGRNGLFIGASVNISTEVMIWSMQHDTRSPEFAAVGGPVHVHDYAWLSTRSIILPGVTVGEGAVVAAGAVVTKNVEPYTIVGGIPAKAIGCRPRGLAYRCTPGLWFA